MTHYKEIASALSVAAALLLCGCSGDDGRNGTNGVNGSDGAHGLMENLY